ncbi:sharpin [Protobothrops mucrosquamatus]|uniref:sharpin n=1 Tax=Protobothrops mucrosquamatus TaxID=103944 RepID=UPI0010FB4AB9|nr:sharpin [Protobothrops mucrosquamatus]
MPGDVVPQLRGFPERRYSPPAGRVRLRSRGSGAGCRRGAQSPGGTRVGRRRRLGGHSSPPSGLPEPHPPRHLPGWKSHRAVTARLPLRLPLPPAKPPTGCLSFGRAADDNSSGKPRPSRRRLDAQDLVVHLSAAIELGNEEEAMRCASLLAQQHTALHIQLKESCYPASQISMKVQVEDASCSANITARVHMHTTIAALRHQVFQDYGFHPTVQRWIIGQCLCVDNRTVGSYGIRKDGDTAFLYLLSAKGANLSEQRYKEDKDWVVLQPPPSSIPGSSDGRHRGVASSLPNKGGKEPNKKTDLGEITRFLDSVHMSKILPCRTRSPTTPAAGPNSPGSLPPSSAQAGWSCPTCTFINKPTRPGCEMCSTDRPAGYVVPGSYRPDEVERWRMQQEKEGILQYQKALEQERRQNFQQLCQLEDEALVPNQEEMECRICYLKVEPGNGVMLRECLHSFCRDCLRQLVNCNQDPQVSCPFRDDSYACTSHLQDREIRALVTWAEYERFLERRLAVAESRAQNSYHCRTADCLGWCVYEDDVNEFRCPICWALNCLVCKAIHEGMNCKQYQDKLRSQAHNDAAARETNNMLKTLVQMGEAMHCPACRIVVQKKGGCDWIRCPVCQTEICWVTKGPRWGPGGHGDISGGCRCNVNGERCHRLCQNCH